MSDMEPGRERCRVMGKVMFPTKAAGKAALSDITQRRAHWAVKWCPFCSNFHLTSSAGPRRGKKDAQRVTRGKR
jgi:hypothetical protein